MTTAEKLDKETIGDGSMRQWCIETGKPNRVIMMPHRSKRWAQLMEMEKDGTIRDEFPKTKNPKALLGVTEREYNEAVVARADYRGDVYTEDPEVALQAYDTLDKKGKRVSVHPRSYSIKKARDMVAKQELAALESKEDEERRGPGRPPAKAGK